MALSVNIHGYREYVHDIHDIHVHFTFIHGVSSVRGRIHETQATFSVHEKGRSFIHSPNIYVKA